MSLYPPLFIIVKIFPLHAFRVTSDSVIISAALIKHNLEISRGEGKSIVFNLIFTYCVYSSFLMFQVSFF